MAIAERKRAKMGIKGTIAKMDATVEGAKALKTKYGVINVKLGGDDDSSSGSEDDEYRA